MYTISSKRFYAFSPLDVPPIERHSQSVQTAYSCSICENDKKPRSNKQGCIRHIFSNHIGAKDLYCKNCSTTFETKIDLRQHAESYMKCSEVSVEQMTAIQCPHCERIFFGKKRKHCYKQHSRKHLGESLVKANALKANERQRQQTSGYRYQCYVCKKYYLTLFNLERHMTGHDRNALCFVCGAIFSKQNVLKKHLTTHAIGQKKNFPCQYCDRTFLYKDSVVRHTAIHTGIRPFKCTKCNKTFATAIALKEHDRLNHLDVRYECPICLFQFKSKKSLRRHRFVHTGEYPHKCKYCTKEFRNNFNCKAHMRKNHHTEMESNY